MSAESGEEAHQDLRVGAPLPRLSGSSDLNYELGGLRNKICFVSIDHVPHPMRNLESDLWKNSQHLKQTFKKPGKRANTFTTTDFVFPTCLLLGTKTLNDRLVVVNWWLNLSKDEQKAHTHKFKALFSRPTKSASPLPLRSSAAGARLAEERGVPPGAVSVLDSVADRTAWISRSRSFEITQAENGRRKNSKRPPATDSQVFDSVTRGKVATAMKAVKSALDAARPNKDAKLTAEFDAAYVFRVKEPRRSKHGGRAAKDTFDTRLVVLGESEASLSSLFGPDWVEETQESSSCPATVWYASEGDKLPELVARRMRKRGRSSVGTAATVRLSLEPDTFDQFDLENPECFE